jgi:metallo-beta-lactamase family protein
MESTYGDRLHPKEDVRLKLKTIISETISKGGTLIIPSFAVERAQLLMYLLWQMKVAKEIPELPMIMDSPMSRGVLNIFERYSSWHKLSPQECEEMCKQFTIVDRFDETKEWIWDKRPKIIIAGSGMLTGGRVLSYLQEYISKPETTVLLAGFQSEGTRGRKLLDGTHEIKIFGKYYAVNARIEIMSSLSGHGDQQELLHWMSDIKNKPQQIFLTHGEHQAADALRVKIKDVYGWDASIPELHEIREITF